MPVSESCQVTEDDKNRIMQVSLPAGNSVLMGSDCGGDWPPSMVQGNNFSVSVTADSKEEADRIFNALSVNAKVTMPMDQTFWGYSFGMLTDQFGVNWIMSFNAVGQQ